MEKARKEAEERLFEIETDEKLDSEKREIILSKYTQFVFDMENNEIDYSKPLEEHERVFRGFQKFREFVKKTIGQEKMYSLLGTDRDVTELYSEQKKLLLHLCDARASHEIIFEK